MKRLGKGISAVGNGVLAVLDFVLMVRPGTASSATDRVFESNEHVPDSYDAHMERCEKLRADNEERRRRGHDQYYGYNW